MHTYKKGETCPRYTLFIQSDERPIKVRFQRYIVGRPNLLTLKINLVGRHLNPLLHNMGSELVQYFDEVDVWCKNDEYPPIIEIDQRVILPTKPFKFFDLNMMLPEGMWLHRKYDRIFGNSIASVSENFNHILSSTLFAAEETEENDVIYKMKPEDLEENKAEQANLASTSLQKAKSKVNLQMPIAVASSKKLMQIKSEGADAKAIKKLMKKGASKDAKSKKKK